VKLEIRNLQSSATYTIDPEGAILGREGSKADIILRDQAVSKKHAKIYEKNGRWYLEDLASSNGTFLDNRRITEPVILSPGSVFALSENQFEVVQIMNGKASALDMDTGSQDAERHPLDDLPPLGMTPGDNSVDGDGKRGTRSMGSGRSSRLASPAQMGADPADDMPDAAQGGIGYFFVAIPKAIAYYLAAIPLIVLNPIGTIRKSIENQRFPAMGAFPLIAYAIPAYVVMMGLPVIAGMIGTLLAGAFTFPLITFLINVAIGIGVAAASGFLLHPLGNFFINKLLKGDSNEKSRTNYFISILPVMALAQLPAAVLLIVAGLRIPFILVVPAFLTFVLTMILMFGIYSWMKHFAIVKWAQTVLLVLLILAGLGTGWGVVGAALAGISMLGSGGSPAIASTDGLTAEQKAQLEEASKQMAGMTPEEAQKRAQELLAKNGVDPQEAMKKAMAESAKLGSDPALSAKQAEEAVKAAKEAKAAAEEAEKAAAKTEKEKPAEEDEKPAEKEKPVLKSAPVEEDEPEEKPAQVMKASSTTRSNGGGPSNAFQEFITQRKEVDEAIEKDPMLLKRKDVLAVYEKYLRKTLETRAAWKKKKSKDEVQQKINDRMKDIAVYEATKDLVEELHEKIYR
jgi:pSer/pThr/pTyr-binding forkhead associated (FHA) protein